MHWRVFGPFLFSLCWKYPANRLKNSFLNCFVPWWSRMVRHQVHFYIGQKVKMFTHSSRLTMFRPSFQAPTICPHFEENNALKTSQPFVKKVVNDREFLNEFSWREKLIYFIHLVLFDKTALMAFSRQAIFVNGGLCRPKGVHSGVLETSWR